jgi:hypothetical protein
MASWSPCYTPQRPLGAWLLMVLKSVANRMSMSRNNTFCWITSVSRHVNICLYLPILDPYCLMWAVRIFSYISLFTYFCMPFILLISPFRFPLCFIISDRIAQYLNWLARSLMAVFGPCQGQFSSPSCPRGPLKIDAGVKVFRSWTFYCYDARCITSRHLSCAAQE